METRGMDDGVTTGRAGDTGPDPAGVYDSAEAGRAAPPPWLVLFFAGATGVLVANLYYAQPIVALVGGGLDLPAGAASAVVTAAQLGYALGLVLLVPLGDMFENRRLILATMATNVAALAGLVLAPGAATLFALVFVVGTTSVAAQMIVPLAASLTAPAQRGRVVGNVMFGLLTGILLARPVASFLAEFVGWRGVFAFSAGLVALFLAAGLALLPRRLPAPGQRYRPLIASLGTLFVREPVLRRRALYHASLFGAFSLFWTAAPVILLQDFGLSPAGVALFALAGLLGVFAAPVAGRLADAGRSRAATIAAMACVVLAFGLALLGETRLLPLVLAGILVDLGVQANLVLGQRDIFQLDETIRNRLNAVYMTTFFLGGAAGSALASPLLEFAGWWAVCLAGAGFPALALLHVVFGEGREGV